VIINQAIEQLGQEQFQGKDIIGKWFPASYLFKSPKDAQSNVEFFTAENLGLKYLVMYQLPLSSQESKVVNLLIKFSLSKSTSIMRFSSAATILQELDAFLAQLCKAMGKADASWNATALVIDENMKELEFASSKFSLLQQEGRTFRIFESDKASQAKEQYLVRCLPIKPGAVLFVPSLSELPEHFTDWLAKISSMDNPQIYEEEISVWKGTEDLAVLMPKF